MEQEQILFPNDDLLDLFTFVSVSFFPPLLVIIMLGLPQERGNEEFKFFAGAVLLTTYIVVFLCRHLLLIRRFACFALWCMGALAIYTSFPLWLYPIYVICPILWYIRYLREKKHER